jgi:hypothetical protein
MKVMQLKDFAPSGDLNELLILLHERYGREVDLTIAAINLPGEDPAPPKSEFTFAVEGWCPHQILRHVIYKLRYGDIDISEPKGGNPRIWHMREVLENIREDAYGYGAFHEIRDELINVHRALEKLECKIRDL